MTPNMETLALARAGNKAAARCMYLDYVNDFLTVAGFAAHYGLAPLSAQTYLQMWRDDHETFCAAIKAPWDSGYRAGLEGLTYADNPIEGENGATAWAFGCSEGMKERNRLALGGLLKAIQSTGGAA